MNSENANYLLGILKKKKNTSKREESNTSNNSNKKNNNSNVLIQQLMQIQKNIKNEEGETEMMEERFNEMKNQSNEMKNQSNEKKSFKNILLRVIEKLEDDVDVVSKKIEEFNEEKKSIMEMNQKEIKRLKTLIRKLYKTILTIYESLDVNKNTRVELLERLKRNIESNKIFLQNIQEINMIRGYVPNNMKMNEKEEIEMAEVVEPSQEEEVVMANTEVSNKTSNSQNKKYNLTIFNLIEKNKPENSVSTPVVEETSSEEKISEPEEPKEMKEKRLNMSKKVSRKLNEMPTITNQQARNSLNQFLRDRMGSPTPRMNQPPSNNRSTPPSNNRSTPPSNNRSTPPSNVATLVSNVTTSQSNQNKNKKNNSNIFI